MPSRKDFRTVGDFGVLLCSNFWSFPLILIMLFKCIRLLTLVGFFIIIFLTCSLLLCCLWLIHHLISGYAHPNSPNEFQPAMSKTVIKLLALCNPYACISGPVKKCDVFGYAVQLVWCLMNRNKCLQLALVALTNG